MTAGFAPAMRGSAVALVLLLVAACTGDIDSPRPFRSTLAWGECPADVESTFVSRHRCGRLTVLVDRAQPDGPTMDLLVTKVWPQTGKPAPGLATNVGQNIGDAYRVTGDSAARATRLGRIEVELEWRGAGPHNEPSLRCTEVDELRTELAAATTDEQAPLFVDAVAQCADRLRGDGVDPADFDLEEAAADLEDLRRALGVERWARAGSYGSSVRVLYAYLDRYPDRVGPAFLDSPVPPHVDDLTLGVLGTRETLDRLFATCDQSESCSPRFGDLRRQWTSALQRLDREPLEAVHTTQAGERTRVVVDAGKLLRAARFALGGDGPWNLQRLPAVISDAARGRLHPDLGEIVATDPGMCFGYRPKCSGHAGDALGVHLTVLCRDQLAALDRDRLEETTADDPLHRTVFGESPYLAACEAWDVPVAEAPPPEGLPRNASVLLMTGEFDSFGPPGLVQEWARGLDAHADTLLVPGATHDTSGSHECARTARNAWVRSSGASWDANACAAEPAVDWLPTT